MSWPIREFPSGQRERRWRFVLVGVLLLSCHVGPATAAAPCPGAFLQNGVLTDSNNPVDQPFRLFRPSDTLLTSWPETDGPEVFRLFLATEPADACLSWQGSGVTASGPSRHPPNPRLTRLVTVGMLTSSSLLEYAVWWKGGPWMHWHFTNEGWFDPDTYAGGADKAAHFIGSYFYEQILEALYRSVGLSDSEARTPALLVTIAEGLLIEVGDGFTGAGFSWQDLTADALGALAAEEIRRRGWEDMIGLRFGTTGTSTPTSPSTSKYSNEMYLVDAKLKGIIGRLGKEPGLARYFLVSASYQTKGYGFLPPDQQQRNLGIEFGPNLPELLRAIGVRDDSWWGKPLLVFFTFYRPPFTTIGMRYDFNARRWRGPDAGNKLY